ncbi:two-component regulator propeller domain-containing protein [Dysgonomonas sp. 520]|uniref:two-component regulator propeller domain-containing protein n=1 Tax=Dysgonomonas sp. 520 TaxID=2302931 RepID=UPI0013D4DA10|nr:two-component regulator propeller domain-containing protein [Dysgonomonas sp. 520]NDW08213.1 hybrid sensor histidine kinase/response regulator [Dysgonomonas sp. 520]
MRYKVFAIILFIFAELWSVTPYKTYTVADGLSNSSIKAICQDSLGYVWCGTKNGLIRFDGYEFRTYNYNVEKEDVVYSNDITCLTKDSSGLIWIGTFNWIIQFDPYTEKFVELDLKYSNGELPKGVVTNIWIDKKNKVWISSKTGLYVIEEKEVKAIESLKGAYINSMAFYDAENLLLEVMNKGVALFNTKTNKLQYLDESKVAGRPMIYKIFRDSKGKVWMGADSNNIFTYEPSDQSLVPIKIQMPEDVKFDNDQIHDILEYNDSILILGTDNGLLGIDPQTHTYRRNISSMLQTNLLLHNRIMSLYKDNQGALWVGTFNKGMKYCNPNRYYFNFYDLDADKNQPAGVVGNLVEENGTLWIGHERGICLKDMKTGKLSHFDLESKLAGQNTKFELFFIYKDVPHLLYLYLLNRGIYTFDLNTRQIGRQINIPPASQVRSMAKDMNGNIWIAEEELSVYNPQTGEVNSNLSTNFNNITSFMMAQDVLMRHNGNMLVGTRTGGVWEYEYDEQHRNKYLNATRLNFEQLKDKNVNVLFEDSKNNIWIGTYGSGLFRCDLDKKECSLFDVNNGLAHNSICGILEDETNGDIWVATLNGVSKISEQNGRIINYTGKMGFPLAEVSRKAFIKGSDGLFYVGGSNGLTSFDPNSFRNGVSNPPAVRVSLVQSLNTKDDTKVLRYDNFEDLKKVEFPFNHSSIFIQFSALNYFFPRGTQYAYKLEGFEDEWKYTERNDVVYSNLPEGEYVFCIKSCDSDGVWHDEMSTIKITIHPPIWRTTWAKILYVLAFLGLLYFIIQYFNNKKTSKYRQEIDRIEKDNIEKYYQMKLDFFTKFSHELRTPLTLITGPVEDLLKDNSLPNKLLYPARLIYKNTNKLLLLVNQLMDFRKMEHGAMSLKVQQVDIDIFLSDQIENFNELARKKGISLAYMNQYWEKDIWFDAELMEKVIFNLLSNAIKHTNKDGEIVITSKKKDGNLIMSVRDNGEGIAKENLELIFNPFYQVHQGNRSGMFGSGIGLNLAKYIVTLHNGRIWVESTLGDGSEFFVELPLGKDHFEPSHTEIIATNRDDRNRVLEKNSISPIEIEKQDEEKSDIDNKPLVLVIEDDDDLRYYITSQLSDQYSIIEAADGKEALAVATDKLPDLIISDIQMPVMDGIEFCKLVKDDLRTAHIPVILLTARIMSEHIQEGYEALADDYILKPFDANLLKVRVRNLINNRIQLRKLFSSQLSSPEVPSAELTTNDSFLEKLFEIVRNRIEDPELSINDLSEELGVSRAQFFRKIKAISDVSPNKIIQNIRMKMAADFLKTKQFTVAEVAYKVGFSDPAYFSKTFKSVFNITPTDFIKEKNTI